MRDKFIKIRATDWEKSIIQDKAKRAGLSTSDFLRKLAFEAKIKARLTPEEIRCYHTLKEYKNHFKRITNLINKNDSTGVRDYALQIAKLIQEHLKKFE